LSPERFLARPGRTFALACAVIALVTAWAFVVPDGTRTIDRRWAVWMQATKTSVPYHAARFLEWVGDDTGRSLAVTVVVLALLARRRWLGLVAFCVIELLTPLATELLKRLAGRTRPSWPLVHATGASFPSGHTSYAAATLVALVLLYTRIGQGRRRWWALVALGTAVMGWSRTYVHAHWLSDVVAGGMLGWALALAVFAVAQAAASSAR